MNGKLKYDFKSFETKQYKEYKNLRLFKKYGLSPILNNLRFGEFLILLTTYKEINAVIGYKNIQKDKDFKDNDCVICTIGYDNNVFVEDIYYDKQRKEPKRLDGEFIFVNYSKVKYNMIKNINKDSYLLYFDITKGI